MDSSSEFGSNINFMQQITNLKQTCMTQSKSPFCLQILLLHLIIPYDQLEITKIKSL